MGISQQGASSWECLFPPAPLRRDVKAKRRQCARRRLERAQKTKPVGKRLRALFRPRRTQGGKSNVQAVGSTNSYLRRYFACNIFNIVIVGDDDDRRRNNRQSPDQDNSCSD
jgi:hypothetical protein